MIETDVLIVGSGPAGSSAAALLAMYGVKTMLVTKWNWTCRTPRAHITNQRTMEVLRDLGVEADVMEKAAPQHIMGNNVFCTSLAGEELGRLQTWGTHPSRQADWDLASPTKMCDMPQNLMEPILIGAAGKNGATICFNWEYLSLTQDADGVTAKVKDHVSGVIHEVRAKYLLGADGGRSKVAEDIALPMEGKMGVAGSLNIVIEADLSKYVAHRPSVLYWVMQPGSDVGGIGMGVVRMVRPWNEWLLIWGYDINEKPPILTDAAATEIAHNLIGDHSIPIKIKSTSVWTVNDMYALENSRGRVFCMGDAVHRHPPSNGLGSNTSIQDAYNLAWKIAHVLKGKAGPELLSTYNAERSPIAKQIVKRANQSIGEFGPIFEALGLLSTKDPEQMKANMAKLKDNTPAAIEQREKLRQAIDFKSYEFNCHGVELNQRYASSAVVGDGTAEPAYARDKELYYQATSWPGARLPHAWLEKDAKKVSTLDLCGKGKFTLLTGIGGELWVEAAKAISAERGIEIATVVIGPGRDIADVYGNWHRSREISDSGCLLVRPDQHVAFRAMTAAPDARRQLANAFGKILGTPVAHSGNSTDPAFTRRLEPVAEFPVPNAKEREAGWAAALPGAGAAAAVPAVAAMAAAVPVPSLASGKRQWTKYPYFEEATSVDVVLARMGKETNPRLREILNAIVKHSHAAVKDVRLTTDEWLAGIQYLTRTGHMCNDWRQEFILLSDVLGISMLVDTINNDHGSAATESTVLGPFYVENPPKYDNGTNICLDGKGEPLLVIGRVLDSDGRPIAGATVDAWQTNNDGFYDVQQKGVQPDMNLRGVFTTDSTGGYWFKSAKPRHYPIPADGPVGDLLKAVGRNHIRAAHIHFIVSAPGHQKVVTHVFPPDCPYLEEDAVFGMKESLIGNFEQIDQPAAAASLGFSNPYWSLNWDFRLAKA
jgi:2,4-dichlorophenol 6-monooxygenase